MRGAEVGKRYFAERVSASAISNANGVSASATHISARDAGGPGCFKCTIVLEVRRCDQVPALILTKHVRNEQGQGRCGQTLNSLRPQWLGDPLRFDIDANVSSQRHLGDGNKDAAIRNVVNGGNQAVADQAADQFTGFPLSF